MSNEIEDILNALPQQDHPSERTEQAEDLWIPEIIILGPGGVKGFLELGALLYAEKINRLSNVKKYVGVSIGAVIGLMMVAGYTITDIISDAVETNLLQDITSINLNNVKANKGLISNRAVKDRLISRMKDKFGMVPTLKQLYLATGVTYVAVATNLDKWRPEHLSWESDPNLSCVEAAILSMNIPGIFYLLKYKGCVYVDGAFSDPYPIARYDDGKTDILGIYITTDRLESHVPVDSNILLYLYKCVDIPMTQMRKMARENASPRCRHMELFANTIDTVGITLTNRDKIQMIYQGYHAATRFFQNINHQPEIIIYDSEEPVERASESSGSESDSDSDVDVKPIIQIIDTPVNPNPVAEPVNPS